MSKLVPVVALTLCAAGAVAGGGRPDKPTIAERLARINSKPHLVQRLDADGDGTVTEAEVLAFRQAKIEQFDADGDGKLNREERQAHADRLDAMRQHLTDLKANGDSKFDRVDQNSDGALSDDELMAARRHHRMKKTRGDHTDGNS